MTGEATDSWRDAPFRHADFTPVDLDVQRSDDGTIRLTPRMPLEDVDPNLARAFFKTASEKGGAPAIGARDGDEWRFTSYADLAAKVRSAAQWMLGTLPPRSVLVVMAENKVEVAALTFAAYATGTILAPISPAYGMAGGDHARLRHVFGRVKPAAVFADPNPKYAAALRDIGNSAVVISSDPSVFGEGSIAIADVLSTEPTDAVERAVEAIDPDDSAQYMLTSGSTGLPKVVEISLSALGASMAQGMGLIGRAAGWHEDMLDWLPWHHAAGAAVLRTGLIQGGLIHIDAGKPAPGLFDQSIRNLRDISVPYFNNVPLGYAMLVDAMDRDTQLRDTFFKKMRLMLYGGAGLPQQVYDRLQEHAVAACGHRVHMTTGYGMTETVSGCCAIHFPTDKVGIGLPGPGVEMKLVPRDDRYEVRMRGPMVMKSYYGDPDATEQAFDEEGYYRTGDLAVFHDPERPEEGLAFAGRFAEEFKLANGTWVYGGQMRERLMAAIGSQIVDFVLTDDGRPFLGLLVWLKPGVELADLAEPLRAMNAEGKGASATIRRVRAFGSPPSADWHEISDKGTINRRAVLDHRGEDVDALYAAEAGDGVLELYRGK